MYFKALITTQKADGTFENKVGEKSINDLPDGDLLVRVEFSSLNLNECQ